MYSLRRTLAVRFSLTMLVALTLIAAWAFLGVHRAFREDLDRGLNAALSLERDVLAAGSPIALHTQARDLKEFVREVNRFVALRDETGRVVSSNVPFAENLAPDTLLFRLALEGQTVRGTQQWGEQRIRSVYAPAPAAAPLGGRVIQVAASLTPIEERNRRLLFFMAGTVLLGTLATAFGAGWLSGSALAPVAEITAQAESIQPESKDHRITIHAEATELAGLVRVLNGMLDRLSRALKAQRRIIADVGHDLRTPLTAMRGQVEVALRTPRTEEQYRAVLRAVLEEIEHLTSISEAMILLARLEADAIRPKLEAVDLLALADSAIAKARARSGDHSLQLVSPSDAVYVQADPRMLALVLDQLLDNALRHTPAGTGVQLWIESDREQVMVAVRDSGPGISPDVLPEIFEHFSRGDQARTRTAGAGLGLTLARAITLAHSGTIGARNLPGGGFEVSITLKRAALPEPASSPSGGP
ncbi:Sensor kinase CusS [bacterium HR33]|nr:Sensor kinase CusS [bacterium HR33]